jgi:hypothetical protein
MRAIKGSQPSGHFVQLYKKIAMRQDVELADVIKRFGHNLSSQLKLNFLQINVLNRIASCRTAAMGGHKQQCDCCGDIRYSYNSCGDRHCPKCLAAKQAKWIEKLQSQTLPVKHYHIVFTLPHCLNSICLFNNQKFYNLMFSSMWSTLRSFGYSHYGVETGAVAVLHTWGQNLSLHPHIHCIVPAAGYTLDGKWKHLGKYQNFLFPVHQLSAAFKGKMLDSLKRSLKKDGVVENFNEMLQIAWKTKWVVYCEQSLAKVDHVIKYLGQYTHRVAITNNRILNISGSQVTFIAKDYRDKARKKPVTMQATEFLRRFCLHILPKRFVKIRRYGIYNHTTLCTLNSQNQNLDSVIANKTTKINNEVAADTLLRITGIDCRKCPKCKKGYLKTIAELPRIRSPGFLFPPNNYFINK